MSPARILIIDDDPGLREVLTRALRHAGYEVEAAPDAERGLPLAIGREPDLVVLDRLLPGLDGVDCCRRLRAASRVPILMLTARDEVGDRVAGLDAGADDYLVKPFALEELRARIRALLRRRAEGPGGRDGAGRTGVPPATWKEPPGEELRWGDLRLDVTTRRAWRGERSLHLTPREAALLEAFLRRPRRALSPAALLEAAWGEDCEASEHALQVYVGYLRQKLEAGGEPRLIHTVRGFGYVLR